MCIRMAASYRIWPIWATYVALYVLTLSDAILIGGFWGCVAASVIIYRKNKKVTS